MPWRRCCVALPLAWGVLWGVTGMVGAAPPATPGAASGAIQTPLARCFAETGQCVGGRFLAVWAAQGGVAIHGYPLSGPLTEVLEDGHEYTVQYFERSRLEYHPENAPPYDLLLGQFGRRLHPADPPVAPVADATYFAETGHNLSGRFGDYWRAHGGLAQFGYPLSEEFTERLAEHREYRVQYFERARFEYHPENAAPYDVLLGQFGRRILGERQSSVPTCATRLFASFPRFDTPAALAWGSNQVVAGTIAEELPPIAYRPDPRGAPDLREHRTDYAIQVDSRVRGVPGDVIYLRRPGGTLDGCAQIYESEPELVVGQRLLLFLGPPQPGAAIPTYLAAGGAQSYWRLAPDGTVATTIYQAYAGLPLATLIEQLRAALLGPQPVTPGLPVVPLEQAPLAPPN